MNQQQQEDLIEQHADGKTRDYQFKTQLAQNVSPNTITKTRPPRGRRPKPRPVFNRNEGSQFPVTGPRRGALWARLSNHLQTRGIPIGAATVRERIPRLSREIVPKTVKPPGGPTQA